MIDKQTVGVKRVVRDVQKTIRRWMREWPFTTDNMCDVRPLYICECENETELAAVLALLTAKKWDFNVSYVRVNWIYGKVIRAWHVYTGPNREMYRTRERKKRGLGK
jgi:hypothetical protein